jgi:hypothetical protein
MAKLRLALIFFIGRLFLWIDPNLDFIIGSF